MTMTMTMPLLDHPTRSLHDPTRPPPEAVSIAGVLVVVQRDMGEPRLDALTRAWHVADRAVADVVDVATDTRSRLDAARRGAGQCSFQ